MVVGDVVAALVDVGEQHLVALERLAGLVLAGVVVLHRGQVEVGAAGLMIDIVIEGAGHAGSREDGVEPVGHFGRLVDPYAHHALVGLTRGVASELVQQLGGVHLGSGGLGVLGVDGTEPVARLLDRFGLLAQGEVEAQIGCRGGCSHAAVASADDEQLGVARFHDVALGDLGGGAQPVTAGGGKLAALAGGLGGGRRGGLGRAAGHGNGGQSCKGAGAGEEAATRDGGSVLHKVPS